MSVQQITRKEFLARCAESPFFFVTQMLGIKPTVQQAKVLKAIAHPGTKIAIASGHGIGKSTMMAWVALWFLATRENAKIPCTAPTAHQLEDILWGELRANIARMQPWLRDQFRITKNHITMKNSTGFIVARTARPETPEALQGFHGDNLLFLIDEAAGIDDKIFEVAYGALTAPNARALMAGNPTQLTGFFFRTFHSENSWIQWMFSSIDSEIVDHSFVDSVKKDYGEDSDVYRVRVLGQFPRAGLSGIIPAQLVDAALKRVRKPLEYDLDPYAWAERERQLAYVPVIGVDPAWEGEDRSVIALRQGPFAKILFSERHVDGQVLARKASTFASLHGAKYIFVDKTGVGASCCDFLKASNIAHIRVSFNERPYDDKFLNRRAEIWWLMRTWFEEEEPVLEPYEGLREDLIAPSYGVKDNGKVYLESKEAMRKKNIPSPDFGDALALTFCMPDRMMSAVRRDIVQNDWMQKRREQKRREAIGW